MELKCELSPLVFAELYQLLLSATGYRDALSERLRQVDADPEWLTTAAELYETKWQAERDTDPPFTVSSDHAVYASWLIAPLASTGSSLDFGAQLDQSVTTRVLREVQSGTARSDAFRPAVIAWTLGQVLGGVARDIPVVPAQYPADPDLAAAYDGLVKHAASLDLAAEPWPEITGTATIWRAAGLAEALKPTADGPAAALNTLMAETKRLMPALVHEQLRLHWIGFVDRRNALTHVAQVTGRSRFHECARAAETWRQVEPSIRGMAYFVCHRVADELRGQAGRRVHAGTWESLTWELQVY